MLSGFRDEAGYCPEHSVQYLDGFFIDGGREFRERSTLIGVGLYSSLGQVESEELARPYSESAFFRVETHLAGPSLFEYSFQVCRVIDVFSRLDDHVVHIYLEGVADFPSEDLVHHPLVRSSGVLESERHYIIVIVARLGHECRALLVASRHGNLVVT